VGLKAFFEVDYVACSLAKRKLTSLKCEEKCSSVEKFSLSSHVLGSKFSNGPEDFLVFPETSRKKPTKTTTFSRGKAKQLVHRLSGNLC